MADKVSKLYLKRKLEEKGLQLLESDTGTPKDTTRMYTMVNHRRVDLCTWGEFKKKSYDEVDAIVNNAAATS